MFAGMLPVIGTDQDAIATVLGHEVMVTSLFFVQVSIAFHAMRLCSRPFRRPIAHATSLLRHTILLSVVTAIP
jgi:hypothetical protein